MNCELGFFIMGARVLASLKGEPMSDSESKQGSGLAVAGLVLGIIAAATSFMPIINNLSAILAFIGFLLALIALIGALRGKHGAKGMSIAGVVLCVVSFAVVLITQNAYSNALDKAVKGSQPVTTGQENAQGGASNNGKDYSHLAVGETVTLDNGLSVTVNSVDTSLVNYDDSAIVGVTVTYVNNGSGNAPFNLLDWKGEDANGAQRMIAYYSESNNELGSGTLSAGGSVSGNIYFEGGTVRILYYNSMLNDQATAGWNL